MNFGWLCVKSKVDTTSLSFFFWSLHSHEWCLESSSPPPPPESPMYWLFQTRPLKRRRRRKKEKEKKKRKKKKEKKKRRSNIDFVLLALHDLPPNIREHSQGITSERQTVPRAFVLRTTTMYPPDDSRVSSTRALPYKLNEKPVAPECIGEYEQQPKDILTNIYLALATGGITHALGYSHHYFEGSSRLWAPFLNFRFLASLLKLRANLQSQWRIAKRPPFYYLLSKDSCKERASVCRKYSSYCKNLFVLTQATRHSFLYTIKCGEPLCLCLSLPV